MSASVEGVCDAGGAACAVEMTGKMAASRIKQTDRVA